MAKMNINPIQWHDGMLLMPQHFQQADLRMEKIVNYLISNSFSYYWGVINLEIDEAVLTNGIFRPTELEVIMPDGLIVSGIPDSDTPLQIDLNSYKKDLQTKPLFVYLCVPYGLSDPEDEDKDLKRYNSITSSNVEDINTESQAIDIPRLVPNLSLQVGETPPAHFVTLPIAQVTLDAKSYSLTNYIPPEVKIKSDAGIGQICRELSDHLREKLGYLQQKVQAVQDQATQDSYSAEVEQVRLKLIAGLLPFEAVISTKNSHPFDVYRSLCGLAGQISGIKYGEIPPRFDAYNHLDLANTFKQVISYISIVLEEIQESYRVTQFNLQDRTFTLQLQSEWVGDRIVLGAKLQPGMTNDDLINWINTCVIVTDQFINRAKDDRVLGANRTLVSEVPSMSLIATKGMQLFVVDVDPTYIDRTGILNLFNISDNVQTRPEEIVMYRSNQ